MVIEFDWLGWIHTIVVLIIVLFLIAKVDEHYTKKIEKGYYKYAC